MFANSTTQRELGENRVVPRSDCIIIMRPMIFALAAALICALPLRAAAHDIPNDIQVQAFVKPDGRRLQLLCACRY